MHAALTRALKRAKLPYVDALELNRAKGRAAHWGRHFSVADMQEHLGERFTRMTFFTLIRDPIARLISVYRWQKGKDPDNPCHANFDVFMRAAWAGDDRLRRQARLHTRAQISWLLDSNGLLPRNLILIPADRPEAHLDTVSELLGATVRYDKPAINISPWREAVDVPSNLRSEIEQRYALDFALFMKCSQP